MNYYKRPIWHSPLFYVLLIILFGGIGFVYWSITRPIPSQINEAKNNSNEIIFSEDTTPTLTSKSGKVRITDRITQESNEINNGSTLPIGDTFETFGESRATISFGNSGSIRLEENAQVQILESDDNTITVRQIRGQVYHRIETDKISYAVESLNTRFTSANAIFNINADTKNNRLDIALLHNEIDAQITKDGIPVSTVTIKQGTQGSIKPSQPIKDITQFNEIDIETFLEDNEWLTWNYNQDLENNLTSGILTNSDLPKEIILNARLEKDTVYLDWKLDEGTANNGYRVVMSTENEDPTYPEDTNHFISNNEALSDTWKNLKKGKYHFRVGLYDGKGAILKYSNNVTIDTENPIDSGAIEFSGEGNDTSAELNWSVTEIDSIDGYYIVSSDSKNPSYPADSYEKVSATDTSYSWKNLESKKTYHFRLCVIVNDNCAVYSDNLEISLQENDGSIDLSGFITDNDVYLEWSSKDLTSNNLGFRILMSEKPNPSLNSSTVKVIDSRATTNYTWNDLARGTTYYFSVCEYLGNNTCGSFSNTLSLSIPEQEKVSGDGTIEITAYYTWGKLHINWDTINLKDIDGYYIMVSEEPEPTYPNTQFHNMTKSDFYDSWTVEENKIYYVRACAQKAGACTVYSNELKIKAI